MKRYIPYKFQELRKNPDKNPFIGAWDYVEQYKNDPDVYISFTKIDKIGINPKSQFNTPLGIYCYPLKEYYQIYLKPLLDEKGDNAKFKYSIGSRAPFAGNSKYVNFIRVKDKSHFINDMYKDYGSDKFDRDYKILVRTYKEILFDEWKQGFKNFSLDYFPSPETDEGVWDSLYDEAKDTARVTNPVMTMWNLTRLLSTALSSSDKQASTKWNLILSKDLGYSGFADKSGKGYIHPSEPMQAVFFKYSSFYFIT